MEFLPRLITMGLRVVVITGEGNINEAIEALSHGAMAYLPKPFYPSDLLELLRKVADEDRRPEAEELITPTVFTERGIVGKSRAMTLVATRIFKIAPTEMNVLITGPTGTGKELVAREVHRQSRRANRPFVAVNCGAIPEALIESEMFGHVKGAFTGADRDRAGLLEEANGGTVFLDEIAETNGFFQVKLLRALEERKIRRVGSNRLIDLDVRVVAATNKDIEAEVESGRFRIDLYHRINQEILVVPPLRTRAEDVEPLVKHFIARESAKTGRAVSCPRHVITALEKYEWPGNVRELEGAILRAVSVCDGLIRLSDLPDKIQCAVGHLSEAPAGDPIGKTEVIRPLEEIGEQYVRYVYDHVKGNLSEAARLLNVDRRTLERKYGLRGSRGGGVKREQGASSERLRSDR